jgi:2'-5' RNA ligase
MAGSLNPLFAQLPPKLRAFLAVRPSQETTLAVARFIEELRALEADVSWVIPANLHLTLRFLGDQAQSSRLATLAEGLAEAASRCEPFSVTAAGVGAFPQINRPRVIWVSFESTALVRLAQEAERCAQAAGFAPSARPFTPHLTVGRVRSLRGFASTARALTQAEARAFGVSVIDAMTLYRSELSPSGPKYYEIMTVKFNPSSSRG